MPNAPILQMRNQIQRRDLTCLAWGGIRATAVSLITSFWYYTDTDIIVTEHHTLHFNFHIESLKQPCKAREYSSPNLQVRKPKLRG